MMDDREKILKRVKSDVRSVLLSAPRGVLKRNFRREYMSLVGQDLPLNALGFRSMEEFVRNCPDVVRENIGPTGEATYFVVANAETQHVASLVARQKKPSLKALKKAAPIKRVAPMRHQRAKRVPRPPPSRYRRSYYPPRSTDQRSSFMVPAGSEHVNISFTNDSEPSTFKSFSNESPTTRGGNMGIPPWKQEYKDAIELKSVADLLESQGRYKNKLISIVGYPGHQDRIKQYDGEFRVLLFNNYSFSLNKPVLNVFFTERHWNIKQYPDPMSLPSKGGVKMRIWGLLDYKLWHKMETHCHSLRALYYERLNTTSTNNGSSKNQQRSIVQTDERMTITFAGRRDSASSRISSTSSTSSLTAESSMNESNNSFEAWLRNQLRDKPNGIWGRVIVSQYKKDFNTDPPLNLLETILALPFIKSENTIPDNPVLYYNEKTQSSQTKTPAQLPKHVELSVSDNEWVDVVVVCVNSPLKFYVQRLQEDCSKALERMMEELGHELKLVPPRPVPVSSINSDSLYAVCWSESSVWCRAIVVKGPDSKSCVDVKYPDYGNEETIPTSSLHELPEKFYSLPFQGICCSLVDFESATSNEAGQLFDDLVFEKSCAVLVTKKSHDCYHVDLIPSNENTSIIDIIDRTLHPIESLVPRLPKVGGGRVPVRVSEVCSNEPGYIFVNILGQGMEKMEMLFKEINEHYNSKDRQTVRDRLTKSRVEMGMSCCAQFEGEWHRAKVTKITPSSSKVIIQYIDYGTEEEHEPSHLRRPKDCDLYKLPPQAVKCKLHLLSPDNPDEGNTIIEYLSEYTDEHFQLEMVNKAECILVDESNTNINELVLEKVKMTPVQETGRTEGFVNPNSPSLHEIYCISVGNYSNYQTLPTGNDVFTVIISHCTSPDNFTLQLCDHVHITKLQSLQRNLQAYGRSNPSQLRHYMNGLMGVGRYRSDGMWYRVMIIGSPNKAFEVPLRFVDYGNEQITADTDIVVITKELLDQLPFQAIPAKLHGKRPSCIDEVFAKSITEKQFYCHVKGFDKTDGCYNVSLMSYGSCKLINDIL